MRRCIPPDPEDMNNKRADAAERALITFAEDFGEMDEPGELGPLAEQNLCDLLADLAHYCDRHGLKMERCLFIARGCYTEETENEGSQFLSVEASE